MKKGLVISIFSLSLLLFCHHAGDAGCSLNGLNGKKKSAGTRPSQKEAISGCYEQILKSGKFSADLKLFHMVRTYDHVKPDAKALAGGGILKYDSGSFHGLKFGLAYYGSHKIGGFYSRKEGIGTSLLQRDGDDVHFLGEAYLQYDISKTTVKVGRQRLATPLMEDLYLRILPTVYEAAIIRNRDIPKTTAELGYVRSFSGFASKNSGFDENDATWGKAGLFYIYVKNSSIKHLTIRGEYIKAVSDTDDSGETIPLRDYRYVDIRYNLPVLTGGYFKAQYGGNSYNNAPDSALFGVKVGTTILNMVEAALFCDKISDNNFEVIMASPMYTDWQQGYGLYEPSTAFGGEIIIRPVADMRVRLIYVEVSSDTEQLVDDFSEFNFDLKYRINSWSRLRISFSMKNQTAASERLLMAGKGGREDRNDLRIIYRINF